MPGQLAVECVHSLANQKPHKVPNCCTIKSMFHLRPRLLCYVGERKTSAENAIHCECGMLFLEGTERQPFQQHDVTQKEFNRKSM